MSMNRREFLQILAAASAAGFALDSRELLAAQGGQKLYDLPRFGNVHLLHFTDCHAQLMPIYFREPNVNLGVAGARGKAPHLVGEHLLKGFNIRPKSIEAHAFTYLDFAEAAKTYGKVGGFAHLATLVKRLRASRPGALLLDGGDTWQGSATALWTKGQDMVDACKLLGVDVMTGHWEFTLGADRVKEIVEKDFAGKVDFVAQNVKTTDFEDPVFPSHALRTINGVPVAIIGQAFPYTPIANPRYFVPEWTFGIQEQELQKIVDEARGKGAQAVVLLSHNGMDVDLKLASRVSGIDAILGGHTHDGVPVAVPVANPGGTTLVTNAGCNGKFLAVMDFEVKGGKLANHRYRLLPIFADVLAPDAPRERRPTDAGVAVVGIVAMVLLTLAAPGPTDVDTKVAKTIAAFTPGMLVVALGLDASADDPFGGAKVTADGFRRAGEELSVIGAALKEAGIRGTYHNHAFEYEEYNGRPGYDILFEAADRENVKAEPDVYWMRYGGVDPVEYMRGLSRSIPLLHIKEMAGDAERSMAEIGEGVFDWQAIFAAARECGVEWAIVEQDICQRPPLESARLSIENLRRMGLASGA